jgi:hypothetical protein
MSKPTLKIPNNLMYTWIMDKLLYEADNNDIPTIITAVSFITLLVNWYNNRLLPLIRQFFLIPNRNN